MQIMFKVIVAGGRDFNNYDFLKTTLDKLFSQKGDIEIVSGMARGADTLAVKYASEKQYPLKQFPANWEVHGKSSGYKRNVTMAGYADACVCFWNGTSKGTEHMIGTARRFGLQVRTIRY